MGIHFATYLWAHDGIPEKIIFLKIMVPMIHQVKILHISRQLSKIDAWLEHDF